MTESASQISTAAPGDMLNAGAPLPFARVTDSDGRLHVRGPIVCGHLVTDDRGHVDDDGRVRVTGRVDDVILSGGENIDPYEVEAVLQSHPAIAEAMVYAEASEKWGQRPIAVLVPTQNMSVDDNTIRRWCSKKLRSFKIPDRFEWRDSLPHTVMGKLRRKSL